MTNQIKLYSSTWEWFYFFIKNSTKKDILDFLLTLCCRRNKWVKYLTTTGILQLGHYTSTPAWRWRPLPLYLRVLFPGIFVCRLQALFHHCLDWCSSWYLWPPRFLPRRSKKETPNYSSQEKVAFIYSLEGLVLFYSFEQRMALSANRRKPR